MEPAILSASSYPHAFMSSYDADRKHTKRKAATGAATASSSSKEERPCGLIFHTSFSSSPAANQNDLSSSGDIELPADKPNKRIKKSSTSRANNEKNRNQKTANCNGNDSIKKPRGRPRLDSRDETAADRRRTQIRLAQRAYRHRKETAIVALRRKVVNLEATIENMNNVFVTLHDNLIGAGIVNRDIRLVGQLQAASDQFLKLRRIIDEHEDDDDAEDGVDYEEEDGEDEEKQNTADTPANDLDCHLSPKTSNESTSQQSQQNTTTTTTTTEVVPRISISSGETDFSKSSADAGFYECPNIGEWLDLQQNLTQFNVQVSEMFLPTSFHEQLKKGAAKLLNPSIDLGFHTYSFQETTFARRLQRLTLEKGYRRLQNIENDPEAVGRAYRFTFCFANRQRILYRIREMLQSKAGENLENWSVPFFHIGGAGTHYPRRNQDGSAIYPPNMLSAEKAVGRQFGPRSWVEVETPREGKTQEILDAIGFGGLWFDAHDVEQYLRTKGICLDAQSHFVQVDPSVIQLNIPPRFRRNSSGSGCSSASSITGEWSSSMTMMATTPPQPPVSGGSGNGGVETASDMYTLPEFDDVSMIDNSLMGTNNAVGFDESAEYVYGKQIWPWEEEPPPFLPFGPDFENITVNNPPVDTSPKAKATATATATTARAAAGQKVNGKGLGACDDFNGATGATGPSRPLTFDVDKFIQRLSDGGACLGRAPGYRREMVDNAIIMSLMEAF